MNTTISTIESCDHLPSQTYFIGPNAPTMHILVIFHLKFGVRCVCGVSIIKRFTLKSEGVNIYYVGDVHCSFLGIFVCNKKKLSFVKRFSQIWLETKYEVQIFNHLLFFKTTN
jgi:hypothetical protein